MYPKVIEQHIRAELPFMATENILMAAVRKGGDRQELHEKIRVHSMEAAKMVKEHGMPNDLLERLSADPAFGLSRADFDGLLDASEYTGFAAEQTQAFLHSEVLPLLAQEKANLLSPGDLGI